MELKELIFIKETLQELIADPEIDFGPAYEFTKKRKEEALKIVRAEIAWLQSTTHKNAKKKYCPVCSEEWSGTSCGADDCGWITNAD